MKDESGGADAHRVDDASKPSTVQWRKRLAVSFAFGAGAATVLVCVVGAVLWYKGRPATAPPWNPDAITPTYADLYITTGTQPVFTFRYIVENRTREDYELPTRGNLFRALAGGKGLEQDASLMWDGSTTVPVGQKVNIGIRIQYEYNEAYPYEERNDEAKLGTFMERRLAEIDGFVALDHVRRYEIRFPRPPDPEP